MGLTSYSDYRKAKERAKLNSKIRDQKEYLESLKGTHAKIFIEFVALIIRNKIYTCLKDRMQEIQKKKNYMTVPAALKELDKIELIRQMDGVYRLDHAITATQKDILQAFNLTASTVNKEAGVLAKQLNMITE